MNRRFLAPTLITTLTLAALGISALGTTQAQADTIKIGAITSITGRFNTFGKMQRAGFNVAIREINARGGVLGRPLEVLLEDDASDTNKALAAAEKLVNAQVPLIIGAYASGITKPLSAYTARSKVPLLVATAVDDSITKPGSPYVFRVNNAALVYTETFFELFDHLKDIKTVAVLASNDAFGKSVYTDALRIAKSRRYEVVAQDTYDQGLTDFRPILNRFKARSPDAVLLASYEADSVAITRQAKEVGLSPKFFAGAATGFALPSYSKNTGDAAENVLVSVIWNDDVRYPGAAQLYQSLKTELSEEPSQHAAQSYAAVYVAADAIKRAAGTDRERVRESLRATRINTAFGPVRFLDYQGYTNQNPVIGLVVQIQKGKPVTVWPERIAEGKILRK
jgi:branched-chain amino acid transport system substrate-binding protein